MESQDLCSEYDLLEPKEELIDDQSDGENVATTSTSSNLTSSASLGKEANGLKFVQILQSVGKILLDKSQTPAIKLKKKKAANEMCELLMHETAESYTADKVVKKVANMKQRIKRICDMKRTGNVPVVMKDYEKLFLDLLHTEDNPSITQLECGVDLGITHSKSGKPPEGEPPDLDENLECKALPQSISSLATTSSGKKKRSFSETQATSTDNNELQHTVLQNQLQLINMQKEMCSAQEQRQQQLHAEQMEVVA